MAADLPEDTYEPPWISAREARQHLAKEKNPRPRHGRERALAEYLVTASENETSVFGDDDRICRLALDAVPLYGDFTGAAAAATAPPGKEMPPG